MAHVEVASWCALCRGVGAASMRVLPMASVSFSVYELVRLYLRQLDDEKEKAALSAGLPDRRANRRSVFLKVVDESEL
jgi:hypothetical protein